MFPPKLRPRRKGADPAPRQEGGESRARGCAMCARSREYICVCMQVCPCEPICGSMCIRTRVCICVCAYVPTCAHPRECVFVRVFHPTHSHVPASPRDPLGSSVPQAGQRGETGWGPRALPPEPKLRTQTENKGACLSGGGAAPTSPRPAMPAGQLQDSGLDRAGSDVIPGMLLCPGRPPARAHVGSRPRAGRCGTDLSSLVSSAEQNPPRDPTSVTPSYLRGPFPVC